MQFKITRRLTLVMAAMAAMSAPLHAQTAIPAGKQMRIIVPYSAGGTSDILARKLAQKLGEQLGRPMT